MHWGSFMIGIYSKSFSDVLKLPQWLMTICFTCSMVRKEDTLGGIMLHFRAILGTIIAGMISSTRCGCDRSHFEVRLWCTLFNSGVSWTAERHIVK